MITREYSYKSSASGSASTSGGGGSAVAVDLSNYYTKQQVDGSFVPSVNSEEGGKATSKVKNHIIADGDLELKTLTFVSKDDNTVKFDLAIDKFGNLWWPKNICAKGDVLAYAVNGTEAKTLTDLIQANPSGDPTAVLTKIKLFDTIYEIQGGGGGGTTSDITGIKSAVKNNKVEISLSRSSGADFVTTFTLPSSIKDITFQANKTTGAPEATVTLIDGTTTTKNMLPIFTLYATKASVDQKADKDHTLMMRGYVNGAADLNSYLLPGTYGYDLSNASAKNKPTDASFYKWGTLLVTGYGNGTANWGVTQMLIPDSKNVGLWIREGFGGSSKAEPTWGAWRKIPNFTEVTDITSQKLDKSLWNCGTLIPSGADLNSYWNPGVYRCQDKFTNGATGATDYGTLMVVRSDSYDTGAQIYINYEDGTTFIRSANKLGKTDAVYHPWRKVIQAGDKVTYAELADKVKSSTSDDNTSNWPIVWKNNTTNTLYTKSTFKYQPSTDTLTVGNISGKCSKANAVDKTTDDIYKWAKNSYDSDASKVGGIASSRGMGIFLGDADNDGLDFTKGTNLKIKSWYGLQIGSDYTGVPVVGIDCRTGNMKTAGGLQVLKSAAITGNLGVGGIADSTIPLKVYGSALINGVDLNSCDLKRVKAIYGTNATVPIYGKDSSKADALAAHIGIDGNNPYIQISDATSTAYARIQAVNSKGRFLGGISAGGNVFIARGYTTGDATSDNEYTVFRNNADGQTVISSSLNNTATTNGRIYLRPLGSNNSFAQMVLDKTGRVDFHPAGTTTFYSFAANNTSNNMGIFLSPDSKTWVGIGRTKNNKLGIWNGGTLVGTIDASGNMVCKADVVAYGSVTE